MNNKHYMQLALKLAEKGIGNVSPNPPVGALIVINNKIIGKGYHEKYGSFHAEINALSNVKNSAGSTLFVTLEPCCHYGKTPPCTEAILKSGIKKVVIGMKDPNPLVAGKGINILKKHGISVDVENLNGKIDIFYEYFKKFITSGMPFITLKMAMTLDGKIATVSGDSKWISSEKSRYLVHQLRKRSDAILVGSNTVIHDDPKLTPYLIKNNTFMPLRIILDPNSRAPLTGNVFKDGNPTLLVIDKKVSIDKKKILNLPNVEILPISVFNNKFDLHELLYKLGKKGITSIFVEGGSSTSGAFFEKKLVDKVIFFIAPKIFGGKNAPTPVGGIGVQKAKDAIKLDKICIKKIDSDIMITGYPVY
ncbi:bifunctional diaminohydroxyphosphoribosylaminopyrimidine deaminase/5-amino-6-(5-phosphoribosylamino)uracil reductase RibD [Candidatus Desantisbacteria bacterium]|nr:bifunctional diaminohydroxyphosphoribosylaminopyrimidine deaminase/5-amino-6-(5-phosphoribosylamino)uracil reductase RibD [Candidatus Desantisbacteria bacterium]